MQPSKWYVPVLSKLHVFCTASKRRRSYLHLASFVVVVFYFQSDASELSVGDPQHAHPAQQHALQAAVPARRHAQLFFDANVDTA